MTTAFDAICCGLTAISEDDTTHEAAEIILTELAKFGFVVVQAGPTPAVDNLSCGGSGSCCQGPCRARW